MQENLTGRTVNRATTLASVAFLNVSAGTAGRSPDVLAEVRAALQAAGLECRVEAIESGQDPTGMARQAIEQGAALVIAGGGDGTISAIAAALAGTDVALGVLPLGTLNHFARDLKIPDDLEQAIHVIRQGYTRRIDAAEVNGRLFINNSSLGLYPHLVRQRVKHQRLGWSKWTAFLWAALAVFRRYPFLTVRIQPGDGTELVRQTPLAFIGNNVYSTGATNLGCRERLDEGTLCLYLAHHHGRLGLVRLAISALLGRLDRDGALDCRRACEIMIQTPRAAALVACDGETQTFTTPLRYRILPAALRVLVPE